LEIITDREYFEHFFEKPQNAEILIVSEQLYDSSLQRHNIQNFFVMMEQMDDGGTGELNVNQIFKYTSIKEIFNEIVGKSAGALNIAAVEKKETQIILVTSAAGGVGKTTVAMGMCAYLGKTFKRVLYINACSLQTFQSLLENQMPITSSDIYTKLVARKEKIYDEIKHVIRKEKFYYLPPFKAPLLSLGINASVYKEIISEAKKSAEYDYIIVDTDHIFNEAKTELIDISDRVIMLMRQTRKDIFEMNTLVSNINGVNSEKYIFICNDFVKDKENALVLPEVSKKITVTDYLDHIYDVDYKSLEELGQENSVQKLAMLIF
jgi:cellulose biosynthesis protein BcsQ